MFAFLGILLEKFWSAELTLGGLPLRLQQHPYKSVLGKMYKHLISLAKLKGSHMKQIYSMITVEALKSRPSQKKVHIELYPRCDGDPVTFSLPTPLGSLLQP